MEIKINIEKKFLFILAGVLLLALVVYVKAAAVDTKVFHGTNQIDWEQPIPRSIQIDDPTPTIIYFDTDGNNQWRTGNLNDIFAVQRWDGSQWNSYLHLNDTGNLNVAGNATFDREVRARDIVWFGDQGGWLRDGALTPEASCSYTTGSTCSAAAHGRARKVSGVLQTRAWTSGCATSCDGLDSGWVDGNTASVSRNVGSIQCRSTATAILDGVSVNAATSSPCSDKKEGW